MMLSIIGLHTHYYFYNNRLFIERDEELEKFVIKRNPQIKRSRCEDCHVIQLVRSKHCYFCEKCVKKFQFHSDWYNMCIGATNELIYGITFFLTNCYFFISNIIIWYYILVRSDLLNYLFLIFSLFGLLGIYFLFNGQKLNVKDITPLRAVFSGVPNPVVMVTLTKNVIGKKNKII